VAEGKSIQELKIEASAQILNMITETHIKNFSKSARDFNSLHLHQAYAEKTIFRGRISHGTFSIDLLSRSL